MSTGVTFKPLLILAMLLAATSGVCAQTLPGGMGVDSSLRIQYVFGEQLLRSVESPVSPTDIFSVQYNPRVPVLAGTVEFSPASLVSARIGGSVSVLESDATSNRAVSTDTNPLDWRTRPEFWSWEAGALFHLSGGGGYRFSLTTGYRQERWQFRGPASEGSSRLNDIFTYFTPYIGMQTSMALPWWRAKFEVLGSPFMSVRASNSLNKDGVSVYKEVEGNEGGLVEFRMEGTVGMTAACWVGLFASYSYQELYCEPVSVSSPAPPPETDKLTRYYTRENRAVVGLTANLVF